ncbi:MAG: hypothetical protein ISR99_02490 [Parcubacteria group bacterium]|nr:hypothetical protein [Parcubacteria group bacterium]
MKIKQKEKAIQLRRKGWTYSEILNEVSVAKSTLSLWLRDVGLAESQKQRISRKRIEAQQKGAEARRRQRIELTKRTYDNARQEVGKLSKRELWLIGVALYWAEGSKEKTGNIGSGVDFCNTDCSMVRLYIEWLQKYCGVLPEHIQLSLYVHEAHKHRISEIKRKWLKEIGLQGTHIGYVYFKKNNPKTVRKNTGASYFGTLRVRVRASSSVSRRIQGWVYGITGEQSEIV